MLFALHTGRLPCDAAQHRGAFGRKDRCGSGALQHCGKTDGAFAVCAECNGEDVYKRQLNNRSVELAKKYSVNLEVRSSLTNVPGTIVKEVVDVEGMLIKGVAKDDKVAAVSILEVPDQPGISFKVFSLMAQNKINIGIILQSVGRSGNKDLLFTVPLEDAPLTQRLLEENRSRFGGREIKVDTDVAKVSIVGAGMQSHPGCLLYTSRCV